MAEPSSSASSVQIKVGQRVRTVVASGRQAWAKGHRNRNALPVREDSEHPANDAWRPRSKKVSPSQRGLSLIELVIFIVVISAALAGVLRVFTQVSSSSADPQLSRQALAVAESLLQEVQLMPFTYCDPDDAKLETAASAADCTTAEAMGPEAGETRFSGVGALQFDNVNDYNGYAMNNGLLDITNTPVPGLAGYSARIAVAAADLGSISAASGDALMITVTVNAPGTTEVVLAGYRSRYAPNAAL